MRRELWELIVDIMSSLDLPENEDQTLHIKSLLLDLPVEVKITTTGSSFALLIDVPRWRWVGGFQDQPGRVQMNIQVI